MQLIFTNYNAHLTEMLSTEVILSTLCIGMRISNLDIHTTSLHLRPCRLKHTAARFFSFQQEETG